MERNMWKRKSLIKVFVTLLLALLVVSVPASATAISIGDVFLEPGDHIVAPIMINNVSNVGVANISITYDPSVVRITTVNNSEFGNLYPVINSSIGLVKIGGVDYDDDGLSGDVKLADILLEAVGADYEISTLNLTINELKEASATETSMPATVDSGTAILNLPPAAIPMSLHRYNNVGSSYPCETIFNGSASYDRSLSGSITNYDWDFGDEQYGAGETVEHAYATCKWNGISYDQFNVSLTVRDNGGLVNNVILKTNVFIAGDANGDGEVNVLDAVWVGLHWRATCNESALCCDYAWDDAQADGADQNNDCEINVLDAVIVGANWRGTAW